ncbi:MAG: MFS transporter [Propionivibrio sp.]
MVIERARNGGKSGDRIPTALAVTESWLNSYALPAHRARVFTLYMVVSLGSLALAQQFIAWGSPGGHVLFAVAALIVCAAVMPVSATRLTQPVLDSVASLGLRKLYDKAPVASTAALFSGLAQGAFWGLSVVWADRIGMDHAGIAAFMSVSIIGGALLQWPIGWLTDRLDRGHVISVVALAAATCAVLMFFVAAERPLLAMVGGFVYGGFAFALYPLAGARMMDRLSPGEIFSGNGSLLFLHGIGAACGPVVVGGAMQLLGNWALPAWYMLVEITLAYTAWRLAGQAPADIGQQTSFVPMVRTAPMAMGLAESEPGESQ